MLRSLFYSGVLRSLALPFLLTFFWAFTISGTNSTLVAWLSVAWALTARTILIRSRPLYFPSCAPWSVFYRWCVSLNRRQTILCVFSLAVLMFADDELGQLSGVYPATEQNNPDAFGRTTTAGDDPASTAGSGSSKPPAADYNTTPTSSDTATIEQQLHVPKILLDPKSNFAYFAPGFIFEGMFGKKASGSVPGGIMKFPSEVDEDEEEPVPTISSEEDQRLAAIANPPSRRGLGTSESIADPAVYATTRLQMTGGGAGKKKYYVAPGGGVSGYVMLVVFSLVNFFSYDTIWDRMLNNVFFWVALLHLLWRFVLCEQYLLKFGSKPRLTRRWKIQFAEMLVVSLKIGFAAALAARDGWRFIPAVFLAMIFESQALAIQELGDVARYVVGLVPTLSAQQRLLKSLQRGEAFETELGLVFLSQVTRTHAWVDVLFRERNTLLAFMAQVRTAAVVAASRVQANNDYVGLYSQSFVVERGVRGLGDWIAMSRQLDRRGGLVKLSEHLSSLCELYEALIVAIQDFPTFRVNCWDNSIVLLHCLERILHEAELSLTQQIETYGETTIRDHWPRKHVRVLKVLLGEAAYPLSMFNLKRDAGKNMVLANLSEQSSGAASTSGGLLGEVGRNLPAAVSSPTEAGGNLWGTSLGGPGRGAATVGPTSIDAGFLPPTSMGRGFESMQQGAVPTELGRGYQAAQPAPGTQLGDPLFPGGVPSYSHQADGRYYGAKQPLFQQNSAEHGGVGAVSQLRQRRGVANAAVPGAAAGPLGEATPWDQVKRGFQSAFTRGILGGPSSPPATPGLLAYDGGGSRSLFGAVPPAAVRGVGGNRDGPSFDYAPAAAGRGPPVGAAGAAFTPLPPQQQSSGVRFAGEYQQQQQQQRKNLGGGAPNKAQMGSPLQPNAHIFTPAGGMQGAGGSSLFGGGPATTLRQRQDPRGGVGLFGGMS